MTPDEASRPRYAGVVVEVEPDHLDRPFDYRVPAELEDEVQVGSRVEVVFAGRKVRGLVVSRSATTELDAGKVRDLRRALGPHAWADVGDIEILRWAADRFAAPVAAVVRHALPGRVVDVERRAADAGWFPPGAASRPADPPTPEPDVRSWETYGPAGRALLDAVADGRGAWYWRPLPGEDLAGRMSELVGRTLAGGRDAVVLVPEPVSRSADELVERFGELVVDARGELSPRRTYGAWLRARCGQARVVIGERGAAFWPVDRLGLAVVLDESNPAYKERRSPRHHAREVLLERARRADAVGLLVGTVPSAAAWRLLAQRRLTPITPARAAERAQAPVVLVDDRTDPRSRGRLGTPALEALRRAVDDGRLGVILAARRGEGRAIVCTSCGDLVTCPRCGASLALGGHQVLCEGCGWSLERGALRCDRCGSDRFAPLAAGAERLGEELSRTFAGTQVSVLEGYAQEAPEPPAIVIMTRGSALPEPPGPVGAVVLPDLDGQLLRPTIDAAEDALRLALRLAAWPSRSVATAAVTGGRGSGVRDAVVVVQTRDPDHHAIQALVRWDPGGFWKAEVPRRAELRFPPVATAIRLDVEGDAARVTADLREGLPAGDHVLGPRPLDGGRSGLLLKCDDRTATLIALRPLRSAWSQEGLDVRVDVDPVDVL